MQYAPYKLRQRLGEKAPLTLQHDKIAPRLREQTFYVLARLISNVEKKLPVSLSRNAAQPNPAQPAQDGAGNGTSNGTSQPLAPVPESPLWSKFWDTVREEMGLPFSMAPITPQMGLHQHLQETSTEDFLGTIDITFQFTLRTLREISQCDRRYNLGSLWVVYTTAAENLNLYFLASDFGYQLLPLEYKKANGHSALRMQKIDSKYPVRKLLQTSVQHVEEDEDEVMQILDLQQEEYARAALAAIEIPATRGKKRPEKSAKLPQNGRKIPPSNRSKLSNSLKNKDNLPNTPKKQGKNRGKLGVR